ncbi:TetR/AcrR family transcriptional regulator C-terminal domain-containing protein [Arthrobacter sp. TES]|uniref:TetR/AcrR family transcriptional regulator n=1 Tax=Paenarthrobacter TaxID=1742992 RepID=UPI0004CDEEA5|nr:MULTISPECIES: TetR/AcrR family transcriptional regulator [Paenarthrobacter]ERI36873.2 TetR family transcriptional regulator [Arthrobacter sp. AK-YN10]QOI64902.1 TetR/AcrR family transcriptional regulator C-terminal domain-containing protein [Arthrobacter sp. TES]MCW3765717.1 TetR/AcrR family transcriptional regulator [Paenarthrobacter sp. PAE-2]MCX8455235.1 TetR/AcrR family transcriptional regulator [Paenarthrobacter ureafaciens]MCY0975188.1 TetR/AcrR family transcriptional regulator [Paena
MLGTMAAERLPMPAPTPDAAPSTVGAAPAGKARRRAGRPVARVLDQSGITTAALELIGAKGYNGLTMAALAKSLGVAPSALYNHVSSKDDVLLLLEDHLAAMVDVSAFGTEPWDVAVRKWAWSYRDVFSKHTPLIPVIAVLPVANAPKTLAMYEAVTAGFREAGFPEERIISAIVALEAFVFGAAYDVNAPEDIFDAGNLADRVPNFTAAVDRLAAEGHAMPTNVAFSLGLEALIAGLGALRQ